MTGFSWVVKYNICAWGPAAKIRICDIDIFNFQMREKATWSVMLLRVL